MDATELVIKREFLQEAEEIVSELDKLFLAFERPPHDLSLLDKIFRMMHTLKGSGMAAGFDQLGQFAHGVENLLSMLRTRDLDPTTEMVDLLIRANDLMMLLVKKLQNDFTSTIDITEMLSQVYEFTGGSLIAKPKSEADERGFGIFDDEPTEPADNAKRDTAAAFLTSPIHRPQHIIVCDDEPDIVDLLCGLLEPLVSKVTGVNSGHDALETLKAVGADLIISDLRMPEISGVEFIQLAKSIVPNTPVIFVSGFAERADLVAMCQLGAYDFLEKPINLERLSQSVVNALRLKTVRDSVAELSRLNFHAYLLNSKLVNRLAPGVGPDSPLLGELSTCLESISALTRFILGEPRAAPERKR